MAGLDETWIDSLSDLALRFTEDEAAVSMLWHWYRGLIDPGGWTVGDMEAWPAATDAALAGAYALLVLSGVRQLCHAFASRGISEAVIRDTLQDVRRSVRSCAERYGYVGVFRMRWLTHHLTRRLVELGRLQFEMGRVDTKLDVEECDRLRVDVGPIRSLGLTLLSPVLWVHIPKSGPLVPAACDASFALAESFIPAHFPEHRPVAMLCRSWLLDPQLREYLPVESNIRRFLDRFEPIGIERESDEIQRFVYGKVYEDLADAPRGTRLERAVAEHLQAGGVWRTGLGRLKR